MKTLTLSCPACGEDLSYKVSVKLDDSEISTEYDSILKCPNNSCIYSDEFPVRVIEILELDLDLLIQAKFKPAFT